MTVETLLKMSTEELEKMTLAQVEAHFAPLLVKCRPLEPAPVKVKVKRKKADKN